ncbi:MAG TPA: hypothetical protein VN549_07350, partial [Negativicutes bacterium]|nr:hypothetical protein [Negativicutes bacterium]
MPGTYNGAWHVYWTYPDSNILVKAMAIMYYIEGKADEAIGNISDRLRKSYEKTINSQRFCSIVFCDNNRKNTVPF